MCYFVTGGYVPRSDQHELLNIKRSCQSGIRFFLRHHNASEVSRTVPMKMLSPTGNRVLSIIEAYDYLRKDLPITILMCNCSQGKQ
jgi:hypothetical protein